MCKKYILKIYFFMIFVVKMYIWIIEVIREVVFNCVGVRGMGS